MNKIGFLLSGLLALTGVHLIIVSLWAQKLYPKAGYLVFETKSSGSYDPRDYVLDVSGLELLGAALCLVGVALCGLFYARRAEDHRLPKS